MRRIALAALIAIVGCASLEDRVVFHPAPSPPTLRRMTAPIGDVELPISNDVKIHARLYYPPPTGRNRWNGTILFCPGNAGNMESRTATIEELQACLGHVVLIFDYPGFGSSTGTPTEAGCYEAADAAYRWLTLDRAIAPSSLLIYGESLGGAVAVDLASRKPHEFLVLNRTFTSVPDVADWQLPLMPSSMLMHNRFDSMAKIGKCPSPVFLAQAERDRVIPLLHGQRLKQACTGTSTLVLMRNIGHNDPPPADFYIKLRAFVTDPANRGGATKNVWATGGDVIPPPRPVTPGVAVSSPLAVPSPANR